VTTSPPPRRSHRGQPLVPETLYSLDETLEIGYEEDGVMWVTASPEITTAQQAERFLGHGWKATERVWVGPTGDMLNHKDEEWVECGEERPAARPAWRMIYADTEEILLDGEWIANPLRRPAE